MPPVVALDLRDGRDVAGAECCSFARENHKQQRESQERTAPAEPEACHGAVPLGW